MQKGFATLAVVLLYRLAGQRVRCFRYLLPLLLLALTGGCAQAQNSNLTYSAPLVITKGGTYTGNYKSTDSNVPVIRIQTSEPVILQNCTLVGPGSLIFCLWDNVDLTVRECSGYGTTPTADNVQQGEFLVMLKAKNLVFEHNYMETMAGININRFLGNGSSGQTIKIRYNKVLNMVGYTRNSKVGVAHFVILNTVLGVGNMEIAWNQVINEPNKSLAEDVINISDSNGTPSSPLRIHDNYVQGAYPIPATSSVFNGTGMTTDGMGQTKETSTGYLEIDHNQFVSTCNGGINIAAGHDVSVHDNRVVTSGYLSTGEKLNKLYCGINPFNFYKTPAAAFGNISITNNTVGYANWYSTRPFPNRFDIDPQFATTVSGNVSLPAPLTVQTEQNEWTIWQDKLKQNSIVPGPTNSGSTTTPVTTTPVTTTPVTTTPTIATPTVPTAAAGTKFYRAFNLNGSATTLDGNGWEGGSAAGLSVEGSTPFANQSVKLTPATDDVRATMIRSSVFSTNMSIKVSSVPAGSYQVYFYVWEDNSPETFNIAVNQVTVKTGYNSGATGHWDRLGPYTTTVGPNGIIQATFKGGAANLSGLEIWQVTTTPAPTPVIAPAGYNFYRGVDVNGSAVTIDGNRWDGEPTSNFAIYGAARFSLPGQTLTPSTDASHEAMLRTAQCGTQLDCRLTAVPNGNYQVYAYVWEDNNAETYSIALNGQTKQSNLSTGPAGSWSRIGPYAVTVTDGTIRLTTSGGMVNLSGVEVWQKAAVATGLGGSTVASIASLPPATLYPNPMGQGQTTVQISTTLAQAQQMAVSVLNQMGTVVQLATLTFPAGASNQTLYVGNLSEGTYIVRFLSGSLMGTTINLVRQN